MADPYLCDISTVLLGLMWSIGIAVRNLLTCAFQKMYQRLQMVRIKNIVIETSAIESLHGQPIE
jgi:hypothetical protein